MSDHAAVHAVVSKVCCYSVVAHVQSTISPYNAKVKEKRHKRKKHDIGKETVPASYGFDLGYSYQTAGQGGGGGAAVEDKVSFVLFYFPCCLLVNNER